MLAPIADEVRTQVETLRRNCAEFGVTLYPMNHAEQGIVHVVGPQLGLTQPGMTVVCGDSHLHPRGVRRDGVRHPAPPRSSTLATQIVPLKPFRDNGDHR